MNIAIILGISKYKSQSTLPSCKNDSDIIYNLIKTSEKYDDILFLNKETDSLKVKEEIYSFIEKIEGSKKPINEVFFYFTGHGFFTEDEFYLLLTDFEISKKNQTTLKNSEIDSIIRKLKCNLFIKVIDACQSGSQYIKAPDFLRSSLEKTSHTFNKCYFLSSSSQEQSSYASENISHFTSSFINSIKDSKQKTIRYSDIINYISDDFVNNPLQTPIFITQASHNEIFIEVDEKIKTFLNNLNEYKVITNIDSSNQENEASRLLSEIIRNEKEFLSKENAIDLIDQIKRKIENYKFDVEKFYDIEIEFENSFEKISNKEEIITWINNNPDRYFINRIKEYRPIKKKTRNSISNHFASRINPLFEQITNPNFHEENILIVTDFKVNIDELPFKTVSIVFSKKHENLIEFKFSFLYFISNKEIAFFYYLSNYIMRNWDDSILNTDFNWRYLQFKLTEKNIILEELNQILLMIDEEIFSKLKNQFNVE